MTTLAPEGIQVDIAVISHNYCPVNLNNPGDHVIDFDLITIDEDTFKSIFYNAPTFSIAPLTASNPDLFPYISLMPQNRTVSGVPFYLLETIYQNLEMDLHVSRMSFSSGSKIALNKNITKMTSLLSLRISNVVSSLSWSEIVDTIVSTYDTTGLNSVGATLTVSVLLTSPTPNVYPTILRFNYGTSVTIPITPAA
jgi:hypothetical protein